MSVFVDSSVWFAAAVARDRSNNVAKLILADTTDHVTTDHVLVESWLLLNSRYGRRVAEEFWRGLQGSTTHLELVTTSDLQAAWEIGLAFADQDFSIVDCTSFAVMERLGIAEAASFDSDFAVYRYGKGRKTAFRVYNQTFTRSEKAVPSENYRLIRQAILDQRQVICFYQGYYRELCPIVVGHTRGQERLLAFQFGGESGSRLPRGGEWKCLDLALIKDPTTREGPWHEGSRHKRRQTCVEDVDLDINIHVRKRR